MKGIHWRWVNACVGLTTTLVFVACSGASEEEASHVGEIHWSYEGESGPQHWAGLSEEFALCSEGTAQSPIDIANAESVEDAPALARSLGDGTLTIDDRDHVLDLIDNGHTIQITADGGTTLDIDGITFELVQFHFHAPSEHTIGGRTFPLEIHLVHRSIAGELAVVGAVFTEGAHNDGYQLLVANLPGGPDDARHLDKVPAHADDLLPIPERYYRYVGSLTTPPCSEGVRWILMAEPIEMSAEQLGAFDAVLHENNRPVQDLGSRRIGLISR
jgi:carbonic anhydrase